MIHVSKNENRYVDVRTGTGIDSEVESIPVPRMCVP
jgi:hypothetical protein